MYIFILQLFRQHCVLTQALFHKQNYILTFKKNIDTCVKFSWITLNLPINFKKEGVKVSGKMEISLKISSLKKTSSNFDEEYEFIQNFKTESSDHIY